MIYITTKPPKLQRDWPGHRVRAIRDVTTGVYTIGKGRLGTLTHASAGVLEIEFDRCECCNSAPRLKLKQKSDRSCIEFIKLWEAVHG